MQEILLRVSVFEDVEHNLRYGQHVQFNRDQFVQWLQMYERSVFNIVDFMNQNEVNHLGSICFKFAIHFYDLNSYIEPARHSRNFLRGMERISVRAFRHLRRCSMYFDREPIHELHRLIFHLDFARGRLGF